MVVLGRLGRKPIAAPMEGSGGPAMLALTRSERTRAKPDRINAHRPIGPHFSEAVDKDRVHNDPVRDQSFRLSRWALSVYVSDLNSRVSLARFTINLKRVRCLRPTK